jgi:hypothetical protein
MAQTSDYRRAYEAAKQELADLLSQQEQVGKRLVVVRQSIQTLATLCESEGVEIDPSDEASALLGSSTLADEIRTVLSANHETWMRPAQVKSELARLGRDLSQYANPQSTIHMVLKRMAESGEIQEDTNADGKTVYLKHHPARGTFSRTTPVDVARDAFIKAHKALEARKKSKRD